LRGDLSAVTAVPPPSGESPFERSPFRIKKKKRENSSKMVRGIDPGPSERDCSTPSGTDREARGESPAVSQVEPSRLSIPNQRRKARREREHADILAVIESHPGITKAELVEETGRSERTIRRHLVGRPGFFPGLLAEGHVRAVQSSGKATRFYAT
jgi:hypothetical protein